eukprot:TRINITY_DN2686_c0_g1_i3.p1 TRINITY_DN2686_c0_g1~~TRINITY_DN2686_c0_g1_i3.p1  ORF type:complete len:184 (+),score=14.30 TRINITY_DN2686_c0_g1_i3:58-609(+)
MAAAVGWIVLVLLAFLTTVDAQAAKCKSLTWKFGVNLGTITVPPGTKCTWVWGDEQSHCVTAIAGSPVMFDSGLQIGQGSTFSYTFSKPGKYNYDCCIHLTSMVGTIVVTKAAPKTPAKKSPPKKCVPKCSGRCYGLNGCGAICPYPRKPLNTIKACQACCRQTNVKAYRNCYFPCRGVKVPT